MNRFLSTTSAVALFLSVSASAAGRPDAAPPAANDRDRAAVSTFTRDGVAVELSMSVAGRETVNDDRSSNVDVRFRVTSEETGEPLTGLNPIAWLDRTNAAEGCQAKIRSFLGGSLQARPEADLNTYRIVTLNKGGTVSVIDPLLSFGGSKLITLVLLGGEGADWVLTSDQQTLFVSIPLANEVVAVDTSTWRVASRIPVGERPTRIALQPDGAYLWVATAGANGGASIVDVASRRAIARVATSSGDHDLAFTRDSRFAFVTNRAGGTLSVIDVRSLSEVRQITTGESPVALSYSTLSDAVYVTHADGSIMAIDGTRHEVRNRLTTAAGAKSAGVSPDGRWLFVVNGASNTVYVVDASTNDIVQTISAGHAPDQVSFSGTFAYLRSTASGEVTMIRLSTVEAGQQPDLTIFPAGQIAPEYAAVNPLPAAIVPAPEPNAMLVSNPADRIVYYYSEGMAAPMGSFQNYRRVPLGVLTVRRNLREVEPGVYATTVQLRRGGRFEVPFLLDSPRVSHCFDHSLTIPSLEQEKAGGGIRAEWLFDRTATSGKPLKVRFRLVDGAEGRPVSGVGDLRVLTFSAGTFQKREWAKDVGDGVYEATVVLPRSAVYYVFLEAPSLGKKYRDFPYRVVTAARESIAAAHQPKGAER